MCRGHPPGAWQHDSAEERRGLRVGNEEGDESRQNDALFMNGGRRRADRRCSGRKSSARRSEPRGEGRAPALAATVITAWEGGPVSVRGGARIRGGGGRLQCPMLVSYFERTLAVACFRRAMVGTDMTSEPSSGGRNENQDRQHSDETPRDEPFHCSRPQNWGSRRAPSVGVPMRSRLIASRTASAFRTIPSAGK